MDSAASFDMSSATQQHLQCLICQTTCDFPIQITHSRDADHQLMYQWNPPRRSDELAHALNWHYPEKERVEDQMRAVLSTLRPPQSSKTSGLRSVAAPETPLPYSEPSVQPSSTMVSSSLEEPRKRRHRRKLRPGEREQVAKNRSNACKEHRDAHQKCDPDKCENNLQHKKRNPSEGTRSLTWPSSSASSPSNSTSYASMDSPDMGGSPDWVPSSSDSPVMAMMSPGYGQFGGHLRASTFPPTMGHTMVGNPPPMLPQDQFGNLYVPVLRSNVASIPGASTMGAPTSATPNVQQWAAYSPYPITGPYNLSTDFYGPMNPVMNQTPVPPSITMQTPTGQTPQQNLWTPSPHVAESYYDVSQEFEDGGGAKEGGEGGERGLKDSAEGKLGRSFGFMNLGRRKHLTKTKRGPGKSMVNRVLCLFHS